MVMLALGECFRARLPQRHVLEALVQTGIVAERALNSTVVLVADEANVFSEFDTYSLSLQLVRHF